jgi:hypothetical protein
MRRNCRSAGTLDTRFRAAARLLLVCALLACSDSSGRDAATPGMARVPDGSRPDVAEMLRAGTAVEHHPSDGGGRAWLERDEGQAPYTTVRSLDRFRIHYEVGPLGIASGGAVYVLVSPFWEWSPPQVVEPAQRGYTEVRASAEDIVLDTAVVDENLLSIQVGGRPLLAGERIEIVYGAGPGQALTDRYAERDSVFWVQVDGDGDGTRRVVRDSPVIDVLPGPPAQLLLHLPTVARPGERVWGVAAFVDASLNAGMPVNAELRFVDPPSGIELPEKLVFEPGDRGRKRFEARAHEPGLYRVVARVDDMELEVASNPMLVTADGPRVLWGDLHGHSNFSDGTGVPEDYFAYARDVSALDVVALTDHDHWGMLPLVDHPELWSEIREQTRRFYEPGRFVTLLGFEWTSWIYGHRHVLYRGDEGDLYDSIDPGTEHPTQLWDALAKAGHDALTFAHHSGGGPVATDWSIAPDPRFEPLVEIVSIHGNSEALDAPQVLHEPVPGHFVRDALARGYTLGFVGSGDRHDGHPGAYQVEPPQGGLAAIIAEEPTREAVFEALRARRVYATNGARILLRMALSGHPMGARVSVGSEGFTGGLYVQVIGETPLASIELIRSGTLAGGVDLEGRLEAELSRDVESLMPGEYLYIRAQQSDGGMAWSSPIFMVP